MRMRFFILYIFLCGLDCYCSAQNKSYPKEQVFIHCDKYVCAAGDTIWFKGYVFEGQRPSAITTNLFIELFSDSGRLISKYIFPILNGQSIGQISMPDSLSSGSYWIRAFTKYQTNFKSPGFFVAPIVVSHPQDNKKIKYWKNTSQEKKSNASFVTLRTDTLDTGASGYNSWAITIKDSSIYHYSVSVTDADQTTEPPIWISQPDSNAIIGPGPQRLVMDTTFLQWSGIATRAYSKKLIRKDNLAVMLVKDTTILQYLSVPIDSVGHFKMDHLFFFGKAQLQFQLNEMDEGSKNVKLALDRTASPAFEMQANWVAKDTLKTTDSSFFKRNAVIYPKDRILKEVQIKGWRSLRKELDHQYTTGAFTEPAIYSFDLRTEKRWNDLGSYLRANLPGFQGGFFSGDTPIIQGHRVLFYVDEQLKTWDELEMYWYVEIAYIKAFESDFVGNLRGFSLGGGGGGLSAPSQSTPMIISIYTRKGKDIRTGWPGLNSIPVMGYTPIVYFRPKANSRLTLCWEPLVDSNSFRLKFNNNDITKHFRITIEGFNNKGNAIYYTKILPKVNQEE